MNTFGNAIHHGLGFDVSLPFGEWPRYKIKDLKRTCRVQPFDLKSPRIKGSILEGLGYLYYTWSHLESALTDIAGSLYRLDPSTYNMMLAKLGASSVLEMCFANVGEQVRGDIRSAGERDIDITDKDSEPYPLFSILNQIDSLLAWRNSISHKRIHIDEGGVTLQGHKRGRNSEGVTVNLNLGDLISFGNLCYACELLSRVMMCEEFKANPYQQAVIRAYYPHFSEGNYSCVISMPDRKEAGMGMPMPFAPVER